MNGYGLVLYGIIGLVWMIIKIIAGLLTSIYIVSYFGLTGYYFYGAVIAGWMILCRLMISDKFAENYEKLVNEYEDLK